MGLSPTTQGEVRTAVAEILASLDAGTLRVAEKIDGAWVTHTWIKQAILLSFRLNGLVLCEGGAAPAYDKVPLKFTGWTEVQFQKAGIRVVPGSIVRHSAYLAPGAVVMPSFINVGAHVGENTMVDSAVRVGSCAQIGKDCHLSDNVGIGGVLEPAQANPVIVEDNCFIGANCSLVEGVFVGEGSVFGAGVTLTASTKIVNRDTGEISYGYVPPYSVVVPGTLADPDPLKPSLQCAVIIKQVGAQTRQKTSINELLR